MLISFILEKPNISLAAQSRTVIEDKGTYKGTLNWAEKYEYNFPQSWIGNYPETIQYNSGGYTGTLKAKKIILTPLEKIYHKDPVYRTEYANFTKYYSGTYSTKNDNNLPATYSINENGYTGEIPRTSTSWTTNYNTGRTASLTQYWTDSTYRLRVGDVPVPGTYEGYYYDSGSGKNIYYSLPKSGGLYPVESANTYVFSASYGRAENYDAIGHTKLGYMSSSPTKYWNFSLNFSDPLPRPPTDYYGPDGGEFGEYGWELINYSWDECCVRDSKDPAWAYKTWQDGYLWISERGIKQRYRKGVYLNYRKLVTGYKYRQAYSGTIKLPDTIKDYTGTAKYEGKLSKQVFDHWNEYYTASKWKVQVVYEGSVYSTNLTAKSITITDTNNKPVSHLVKGRKYIAKMVIGNNGELNVGSYKVGLYEGSTSLTTINVPSHSKGTDITLTYQFTAQNTGQRTFIVKADDTNLIDETDESEADNTKRVSLLVNTLPEITVSYTPSNIYEGDNVTVCAIPTDKDNDPLTVKIIIQKDGEDAQIVLNEKNVASGTKKCYTFTSDVGRYDIIGKVNDGFDESEASTWFYSKPLIIKGHVNHTPQWLSKHQSLGNRLNQFYSGEKFILSADISDYPAVYVKSTLLATQADGLPILRQKNLNAVSNILFTGELYDEKFLHYPTNIKKGPASFEFEVKYTNGVIKKDIVPIEIIDNVLQIYRYHRKY